MNYDEANRNVYELHFYGVSSEANYHYENAKRITKNVLADYEELFTDFNYGIAKALAYVQDVQGYKADVGDVDVWYSYHEGILYITIQLSNHTFAYFSMTPHECFPSNLPEAPGWPIR
jgi:hypothetical protein